MRKALGWVVAATWAALLLGGAFRPAASGEAADEVRPAVGYKAPPFSELEAFKGKAVFVNFWASWCGPCLMEMPEVHRLAAELPPGTAVLTINTDLASAADVEAFLSGRGLSFPTAVDHRGELQEAYRVLSFPTSLFISPDGVVTARVNGPISYSAMVDYLRSARR